MFKRFLRIIKGWLNALIGKAENPKLLMGEIISDMQAEKVKATKLVAEHLAQEKMTEKNVNKFEAEARKWEEKAQTAVRAGRDDLAMEALRRKESAETTAREYRAQLDQTKAASAQLKQQLSYLDEKIEEARNKKDVILAKQARAEAQQKIQETLGSFNPDTSAFEAFDRMEQKVDAMQANADAHAELNDEFSNTALEDQFRDLEVESGANDALAALKSRMGVAVEEEVEEEYDEEDEEILALEREFATVEVSR